MDKWKRRKKLAFLLLFPSIRPQPDIYGELRALPFAPAAVDEVLRGAHSKEELVEKRMSSFFPGPSKKKKSKRHAPPPSVALGSLFRGAKISQAHLSLQLFPVRPSESSSCWRE